MKREKGSALITVILVVLVLTMVGIAGLFFMTMEDRLSGNDLLMKRSFYGAEVGLRAGERILATATLDKLDTLLAGNTPSHDEIPASPKDCLGPNRPGAILSDAVGPVFQRVVPGAGVAVVYSLYIRNNADDVSGSPTTDGDGRVTLVSVAELSPTAGGNAPRARKVLAEELLLKPAPGKTSLPGFRGNTGSTSSTLG